MHLLSVFLYILLNCRNPLNTTVYQQQHLCTLLSWHAFIDARAQHGQLTELLYSLHLSFSSWRAV